MRDIEREPQAILAEVLNERLRQITVEGFTDKHDDHHVGAQLAEAAACYARGISAGWPWDERWWKPKSHRRNLIRAAALIVAEIERIDRLNRRAHG